LDQEVSGDLEKLKTDLAATNGLFKRYAPRWEARLAANEGKDCKDVLLHGRVSIADCALFETIDFYESIFGSEMRKRAFAPFPKLSALHEAVLEMPGVRKWCLVERPKLFLSWVDYKAAVHRTLGK